jgi:hypothetical protein
MKDIRQTRNKERSSKLLTRAIILLMACFLCAKSIQAEDQLEIDATAIIGSLETPKVANNRGQTTVSAMIGG